MTNSLNIMVKLTKERHEHLTHRALLSAEDSHRCAKMHAQHVRGERDKDIKPLKKPFDTDFDFDEIQFSTNHYVKGSRKNNFTFLSANP